MKAPRKERDMLLLVAAASASLLSFPRSYSDAATGARSALRLAREIGHRRLKVELPVLQPESDIEDDLRPGSGANTWPGGAAQSHRLGLQPVVAPLLNGYEPNFLGTIDIGMGVWSLAGGNVTAVSNVADLSFETFMRLMEGEYGAGPTRPEHTLLLLNPRLTSSRAIGQPWQRELRRKACKYVEETDWVWAYRCKPIAAKGGLASEGVLVCSELDGLRGSAVFTMDGVRVASSDEPSFFGTSDGGQQEARRALREHATQQSSRRGGSPTMCAPSDNADECDVEAADEESCRNWEVSDGVSERCENGEAMRQFLLDAASTDLVLRLDDSVMECTPVGPVGSDGLQRYRVQIMPLRLPGLTVEPTALISVVASPDGVRYTTERCDNIYRGAFRRVLERLPAPAVEACTEMSVSGDTLVASSRFSLSLPLPGWAGVPHRAMAAGEALIRGQIAKDVRLSVARIKEEQQAAASRRAMARTAAADEIAPPPPPPPSSPASPDSSSSVLGKVMPTGGGQTLQSLQPLQPLQSLQSTGGNGGADGGADGGMVVTTGGESTRAGQPRMLAPMEEGGGRASLSRLDILYAFGGASTLALGTNFAGATSSILALAPEASRAVGLDAVYPVGGFKRCVDPSGGRFTFRYPSRLHPGLRTELQNQRRAAGLPLPLTLGLPVVAFGNGPPTGFSLSNGADEVLSVVVGATRPGAADVRDALGTAEAAAQRLVKLTLKGGESTGRVATVLRTEEGRTPSGRLVFVLDVLVEDQPLQAGGVAQLERVRTRCVVGVAREQLFTLSYRVPEGVLSEEDVSQTIASFDVL